MKNFCLLRMLLIWLCLLKGIVLGHSIGTTPTKGLIPTTANGKLNHPIHFIMSPDGGYSYAYNNGYGMAGQQSASQDNEVTGHYSYYEKGVPYTVMYTAGVNGYRPQLFVAEPQLFVAEPHQIPALVSSKDARHLEYKAKHIPSSTSFSTAPAALAPLAPQKSVFHSLHFVQDALKTMQSQPLQISYNSQHGLVSANKQLSHASSQLSTHKPSAQLLFNAEQQSALPKRPYSYAYNADLSAQSVNADQQGNVFGKYSYRDEAGYHDLAYKAGAQGFEVLGGNLAHASALAPSLTPTDSIYKHQITPNLSSFGLPSVESPAKVDIGRSLRKFQRYTKW